MANKYQLSQSINSDTVTNYQVIEASAVDMDAILALTPKGHTVFAPTATPASGTSRAKPTSYVSARVIGFDATGDKINSAFLNIKYGKSTLDDDDIYDACVGKLEVPNGTLADSIRIKNIKQVGV